MSGLKSELKKRNAFDSVSQEATLSILRTSDLLANRISRMLRPYDLTMAQYNVLRILRGEAKPMPTLEVADRMIQVAPAITRLVENLRCRELIQKDQHPDDGRVYLLSLTAAGRRLLKQIDKPLIRLHDDLTKTVDTPALNQLIQTLETIRAGVHQLDNDEDKKV